MRQEVTALVLERDGVISVQSGGNDNGEQDWIQETFKRPLESLLLNVGGKGEARENIWLSFWAHG